MIGLVFPVLIIVSLIYASQYCGGLATFLVAFSIFLLAVCFWIAPYPETQIALYSLLPSAVIGLVGGICVRNRHSTHD